MNHMYRFFFKKVFFLPCLILALVCSHGSAAGQANEDQRNEDMDTFLMYYEEKDLVVSATRSLKPAAQAAENIVVIHRNQIEDMNAHTLVDILRQETGLFVYPYDMDFSSKEPMPQFFHAHLENGQLNLRNVEVRT